MCRGMISISIYAEKSKSIKITLGNYFGSYLRLRLSPLWLVLLWRVTIHSFVLLCLVKWLRVPMQVLVASKQCFANIGLDLVIIIETPVPAGAT